MFCLKSVQSVRAFRTCATRLRGGKTLSMAATQGATKGPVIGTHDGTFHCDEVLGVAMLRKLPEWSAAEVKRTRDEEELKGCDAVLDVGAEYDPRRMRFDHHQSSFSECFSEEHGTKLSSAGLIYRHFGTRIVAQVLGWDTDDASTVEVFRKVYRSFIEFVDANDNGEQRPLPITPPSRGMNSPLLLHACPQGSHNSTRTSCHGTRTTRT